MHESGTGRGRAAAAGGFSLVELLIVMGIVAAMAAVALPQIGRYIRNYKIRAATQEVLGEIQTARNKAIMKNTNFGVVFVAMSPTTYRYIIEDDQNPLVGTPQPKWTTRQTQSSLLAALTTPTLIQRGDEQVGPLRELPTGVTFGTGCTGFTANAPALRFNRLGTWCSPSGSTEPCPAVDTGQNLLQNAAGGTTICITQATTGLKRQVFVSPGGRAMLQQ